MHQLPTVTKISLCYSRALLKAVGKNNVDDLQKTADHLDIAAEVFGEDKIKTFFENQDVAQNEKETLIEKGFKNNHLLVNFLKLVVTNKKVRELKNIAESFRVVLSEIANIATAKIESAKPLSKKQVEELTTALKKMTGKKITTIFSENSKLLGGVRVTLGDEVLDFSLTSRLQELGEVLS